MSTIRDRAAGPLPPGTPEERYGQRSLDRSERRLRVVGVVFGIVLLAVVGWLGWSRAAGQDVTGTVIAFQVVSDDLVEVHQEVRKDAGAIGQCTLRSRGADGSEVGWKDVRVGERASQVDTVVRIRTNGRRAVTAELVRCRQVSG